MITWKILAIAKLIHVPFRGVRIIPIGLGPNGDMRRTYTPVEITVSIQIFAKDWSTDIARWLSFGEEGIAIHIPRIVVMVYNVHISIVPQMQMECGTTQTSLAGPP